VQEYLGSPTVQVIPEIVSEDFAYNSLKLPVIEV
jgi:hypothetical protein